MIKATLFAISALVVFNLAAASADTPPTTTSIRQTCKASLIGQQLKGPAKHDAVMQCARGNADWPAARAAECEATATTRNLLSPKREKFLTRCEAK